ncbi:TadE family type IV pilus minor pilin [Arthrobacter sp.]|uniref:TadE family type IV pilus minor pilin n=1 Tax=Arthrobacter sp. TaxID=1667 RepID=UPI0028115449|nr:TadE family type IV pilus minor pilin [Arthrobacter sp.]
MTAEVAVAFPAVVALLAVVLAAASVGLSQLRVEEAARAGAREVMRGESEASVGSTVRRIAGEHASIALHSGGGYDTVTVTTTVDVPVLDLFDLNLSARAFAVPEQK